MLVVDAVDDVDLSSVAEYAMVFDEAILWDGPLPPLQNEVREVVAMRRRR